MMRILWSGVIAAVLLMTTLLVAAQDDAVGQCDQLASVETISEVVAEFADAEDFLGALRALRSLISGLMIECEGLTFTSADEGLLPVIGPVVVEPGIYRVTVTTEGAFIMDVQVLDGQCGEGTRMRETVFIVSRDTAVQGAQAIFNSEGCEALFAVDNAREPWTLTFEKLR